MDFVLTGTKMEPSPEPRRTKMVWKSNRKVLCTDWWGRHRLWSVGLPSEKSHPAYAPTKLFFYNNCSTFCSGKFASYGVEIIPTEVPHCTDLNDRHKKSLSRLFYRSSCCPSSTDTLFFIKAWGAENNCSVVDSFFSKSSLLQGRPNKFLWIDLVAWSSYPTTIKMIRDLLIAQSLIRKIKDQV